MAIVRILRTNVYGKKTAEGFVRVKRIPVEDPDDFECRPKGLLTLEEVKLLSRILGDSPDPRSAGRFSDVVWRYWTPKARPAEV